MLIKRLLPKSLLLRSLLIIGTPLIVVQAISIWVFYDRHVDTVTRRMASALAGEIRLIANHMWAYPKTVDREWILARARDHLGHQMDYRKGVPLKQTEHLGADNNTGRELVRVLKERLDGRPFIVDLESRPNQVRILLGVPGGTLEIVTSIKKLRTITTDLFVMWSLGSSIVLLIIAALFMRNQVRPIGQLAHAADSFGKGRDVPGFKPWGAQEVRRASTAFIIMRERLKRQMQQRTEMLAGISHDLRTPLTRLKLQLAMSGDSEDIRALERDVDEMQQMVEEYLAFARGEGTEQAVETQLPSLLEDIVDGARREGHPVELVLRSGGRGSIRSSQAPRAGLRATLRPTAFRRCLNNLIGNAARFAKHIEVSAARRGTFVEIHVDDDGPGIPEAQREQVFRPFVRLENSRNRDSGGAGLGLTIARDVMRSHGGDVLLEDSPLGGLRVALRLPL